MGLVFYVVLQDFSDSFSFFFNIVREVFAFVHGVLEKLCYCASVKNVV